MQGAPLLTVIVLLMIKNLDGHFLRCHDSSSLQNCSCSLQTPTLHELICPQLTLQINQPESVQIQCTNENASFSTLSGLQIGDVDRFVLRLCLLPDFSMRKLMGSIGINKVKILQIQSYNNLSNTLQKKHFEKLYEVTNLVLNYNGLTSVPCDLFEDMGNLTWLDLKVNNIVLPTNIFYFTPKLEVLELGRNNLTHLKPGIFKNLEHLRLLNLWGNHLVNLSRGLFSDVPNLESLDLNSNQMETIKPDVFADLINLKRLNLYGNAFVSLPQGLLSRNTELEEFQMHENRRQLVSLPPGFLSNLDKLKIIKMSGCKLMSLPEDIFAGSKNIHFLYLNHNSFITLAEKTFEDLENVELIDLSGNSITHLPKGLFLKTQNLKTLKLFYNHLVEIQPNLFKKLKKLEYLDLRFNRIQEIKEEQFSDLSSLKALNISDNQLTTLAPEAPDGTNPQDIFGRFGKYSVLKYCKHLEDLQLANNSLSEIYGDWRLLLNRLRTINLSFNNFTNVVINDLDFINNYNFFLDLSNNNITSVDFWDAEILAVSRMNNYSSHYERDSQVRTIHINLDHNPFNCDCKLFPFAKFIRSGLPSELKYIYDIPSDNLKCHEPKALEKMLLKNLPHDLLTCKYEKDTPAYKCPKNCTCHYRPLNHANIINCQNASRRQIPDVLPVSNITNHSELNLEYNTIKIFKIPENNGYENVTYFNLANNNITRFDTSGISKNLKMLDLSNNNLTMLTLETISFLENATELEMLALHGNPWQCDCDSKPLIRLIKNRFKLVKDLPKVNCSSGISLQKLEESELCPEKGRLIVIVCVICAIIGFLLALLTALYYHYRTQIHIYCYSSKWKLLRWLVSHPDSITNMEYDIFISYANQDEKFVVDNLVPHLEENGDTKFKVCLHFRDWIPGESIPNQILHSVKNSRRTIVVLSPNFLESVWGIMEFKTAHSEALKDGASRVIVLMYKDVGPIHDLDHELKDLKAYLQMNTYVKWGSPWFWQQLNYALPHRPEASSDIKCIFGCFPSISQNNHDLNISQKNEGELHNLSDMTKKMNEKNLNGTITKSPSSIFESTATKPNRDPSDCLQN